MFLVWCFPAPAIDKICDDILCEAMVLEFGNKWFLFAFMGKLDCIARLDSSLKRLICSICGTEQDVEYFVAVAGGIPISRLCEIKESIQLGQRTYGLMSLDDVCGSIGCT